jgi:prophage antirepressor-like protein
MTTDVRPTTTALCLDFEGSPVRFVGTKDRLEWIAADVCAVLGIKNVSDALASLSDDEKGLISPIASSDTRQLSRSMLTVYEPGLYRLVFQSRKPAAERFRKWVFNEILPCIRKYGTYPEPRPDPVRTYPTVAIGHCPYTRRIEHIETILRAIPRNHWCVFLEGSHTLMRAQTLFTAIGVPMSDLDLMDGSMGSTYAHFRRGKAWAGTPVRFEYTFPNGDPRGRVFPWAYPNAELPHFRTWSIEVYWPEKFPAYALGKFKDDAAEYKKLAPAMQAVRALAAKA